jgi:LysR family nitrogen assimilation transcriptional regulator
VAASLACGAGNRLSWRAGHARQILRQCDQAVADMHGIQRALPPAVSIGRAPGTPASALALPLLRILRARLPELRPCLQEHHCAGLCEALLGGRLDLAVLPGGRTAVPGLQFQPLLAEPLCLVAAPSLAAPAETVPLRALAQWDLYLPPTHDPLRKLVDEAFSRSGLTPRLVGEIDSPGTLAAVVGAGLGASIVAASRARELVLGGDAWQATITEPELDASLALCQSDHRPLSVAAQAVKDILLELAAHAPGRRLAPPAGTSAAMGAATNPPH